MKNVNRIQIYFGIKEEVLPGFSGDFPYIASRTELFHYIRPFLP